MPHTAHSRQGVTLLEVLVTVAATSILTLIVVIGVRAVRGQALAMKDLHNLRLSAQDMHLWSNDNHDRFLNIGMPDSPNWQLFGLPEGLPIESYATTYWGQPSSWNITLSMLSDKSARQHWQSAYGLRDLPPQGDQRPFDTPDPGTMMYALHPSRFRYSPAFLTLDTMWDANAYYEDILSIAAFFAIVRSSQVTFPAAKALLANIEVPEGKPFYHMALVDGSAARMNEDDLLAPAPYPLAPGGVPGVPGIHTVNGSSGRDR